MMSFLLCLKFHRDEFLKLLWVDDEIGAVSNLYCGLHWVSVTLKLFLQRAYLILHLLVLRNHFADLVLERAEVWRILAQTCLGIIGLFLVQNSHSLNLTVGHFFIDRVFVAGFLGLSFLILFGLSLGLACGLLLFLSWLCETWLVNRD